MGKGFDKNKSAVKIAVLFFIILFTALDTYASYKESELFDQGYEYYLSSQPERAAETFRTFLNEFPDTSVKDAAMFWLGKSLIQLYSFEEAKQVFSEMKEQFSESPFIAYIDTETEDINRIESVVHKMKAELNDAVKAKIALEERLSEIEKKAQLAEQSLSIAVEDRDKLILWLEEEKKITEELNKKVHDLEDKDAEVKTLQVKLEEQQENQEACYEQIKDLINEKEQLDKQTQNLTNEIENLRGNITEYEAAVSAIEENADSNINELIKVKDTLEAKVTEVEQNAEVTQKELIKAIEERDKEKSLLEEEKKTIMGRLTESEKETQLKQSELLKAIEHKDQLTVLLGEDNKETERLQLRIRELEGKETVAKILLAQIEEKQKGWKNDIDQLSSRIEQLEKDKAQVENEREKLKVMLKEYADLLTMMKEKSEEDISAALNMNNTLEAKIEEIEKSGEMTEKDLPANQHPPETETKQEQKLIYSVHIALFGKKADAESLSKKYIKKGYDAFVQKAVSKDGQKISYRVLIGKYEDKEEASRIAKEISDKEKIRVFIYTE
jgi:TolA-binding protein